MYSGIFCFVIGPLCFYLSEFFRWTYYLLWEYEYYQICVTFALISIWLVVGFLISSFDWLSGIDWCVCNSRLTFFLHRFSSLIGLVVWLMVFDLFCWLTFFFVSLLGIHPSLVSVPASTTSSDDERSKCLFWLINDKYIKYNIKYAWTWSKNCSLCIYFSCQLKNSV